MPNLADPKSSSNEQSPVEEPWWNRPLTKRQTIIAYAAVGWLGGIAIMAFGNYELYHKLPTPRDIALYMVAALFVAPFIAAAAAVLSARTRRRFRQRSGTRE